MIRKSLKNTSKSEKIRKLLDKYNIPKEYLSTNRKVISKAVLIGLFIAFIPMPMQMLAVIGFIPFVRFNVPIAIAMCWLTNPITMPLIYSIEYMTGCFILNIDSIVIQMSLEWFSNNIGKIFLPLYTGAFFYAIIISIGGYYLVNMFWKKSVDKDKDLHFKDR